MAPEASRAHRHAWQSWLRRARTVAAALAGIALLAACSGSGTSPAVAGQAGYQKELAYSQCMRGHGEPGFPDPQPNGALLINGRQDHLNGALMNSANKACQHLLPNGGVMTAAQKQQALNHLLKFSACMRAHGLPNFPDPTLANGGVGLRFSPGDGIGLSSSVFQAAQRACQKLMPESPP
jgi:hypothetical protein